MDCQRYKAAFVGITFQMRPSYIYLSIFGIFVPMFLLHISKVIKRNFACQERNAIKELTRHVLPVHKAHAYVHVPQAIFMILVKPRKLDFFREGSFKKKSRFYSHS